MLALCWSNLFLASAVTIQTLTFTVMDNGRIVSSLSFSGVDLTYKVT
jgi:hypothetical protein